MYLVALDANEQDLFYHAVAVLHAHRTMFAVLFLGRSLQTLLALVEDHIWRAV